MRLPRAIPADVLGAALAYAKAGFYVGPTRPGDRKNPGSLLGRSWQEKTSRDPKRIKVWFTPAHKDSGHDKRGLFIHCGRSGVFVIDIDEPDKVTAKLRKLMRGAPYLTTSISGARRHYFFKMPEGRNLSNSTNGLKGLGFDVRGANGVVIVYPTLHPEDGPNPKPAKNPADPGRYGRGRPGVLPVLPDEIVAGMKDADPAVPRADLTTVKGFLETYKGNDKPRALGWVISRFAMDTEWSEDARHNSMVRAACWAMKEAFAGVYPAEHAAEELFIAWENAFVIVDGKRISPTPQEFQAILQYAVSKALASDRADTRKRLGLDKDEVAA